jgi:hypothetical protein
MTGCQCECYGSQFGDKHAAKDLKRYRAKGPDKTTRLLLDALEAEGIQGASVLDVGGGVGVVHHELLATLDRVICCYPDMEQLVTASASRARRLYGAVFPRERWLLKVVLTLGNFIRALRGNAFRTYVHPVRAIDAAIRRQGLSARYVRDTFVWRVAVYSR